MNDVPLTIYFIEKGRIQIFNKIAPDFTKPLPDVIRNECEYI